MTTYKSKFEQQVFTQVPLLKYEPHTFDYIVPATHHKYTPDAVWGQYWLELKGKMDNATRKKMLYIKAHYPTQHIVFVFMNPNQKISKVSKTTYKQWAEQHGFGVWTVAELIRRVNVV